MGPQDRARGRGSRRGRARRYLSASASAVAPRPAVRAGWPRLLQQRGAGRRSGSRSRSGSGARSSPRSRTAGLRMLGAGRPRRAGARLARLAASPRPALTPPASRGGRGAHCAAAAAAGRASTSQRGVGTSSASAALRQRVTPNDGCRALRPLEGGQVAARGATKVLQLQGSTRDDREPGRVHTLRGGSVVVHPSSSSRCHSKVWPISRPPRFCDVTVSPLDVTAGRCRGRGQRRYRLTCGAGGWRRAGWGREE